MPGTPQIGCRQQTLIYTGSVFQCSIRISAMNSYPKTLSLVSTCFKRRVVGLMRPTIMATVTPTIAIPTSPSMPHLHESVNTSSAPLYRVPGGVHVLAADAGRFLLICLRLGSYPFSGLLAIVLGRPPDIQFAAKT